MAALSDIREMRLAQRSAAGGYRLERGTDEREDGSRLYMLAKPHTQRLWLLADLDAVASLLDKLRVA